MVGRTNTTAAAVTRTSDVFVGRNRLFARLDDLRARAVWVQGPTGAGKTVLLRLYTERVSAAVLWLAIDTTSASSESLATALVNAAHRAGAVDLPQFAGEHRRAPGEWVRLCIERVTRQLPDAILVVDDAQRLLPKWAPLLLNLIDICRARMRLMFAAQDLPLGLETAIATAQLVVIGHEQLVFDESEARALARRIGAAEELAAPLCRSTSGWAAGLMLSLQLAQGASLANAQRRLDAPLSRLVHGGVLDGVPPHVIAAMAALAPARVLPLALMDRGEPWAHALTELERLSERGLFVERVDDDLRLHDLLRNALLKEPATDADRAAAIEVLSNADRPELALACIVAMPDFGDFLCDWLQAHGEALLCRDDIGTLVELVLEHGGDVPPPVRLWCARGAMAKDLTLADQLAEQARADFFATGDVAGMRRCCGIGLLAQSLVLDARRFEAWQSQICGLAFATPAELDQSPLLETSARLVEHVLQPSRPSTAEIHALHARLKLALAQPQIPPQEAILAASVLVYVLNSLDRRQEVFPVVAQIEVDSWFQRAPSFSRIDWYINKGIVLTGLGYLEEAASAAATAADLARHQGLPLLLRSALAVRARADLALSDLAAAQAALDDAQALPVDPGPFRRVDELRLVAGLELAHGRSTRALDAIESAEQVFVDAGLPLTHELQRARVQVLFAIGRHDEAMDLATQCVLRYQGAPRDWSDTDRQLLQAQALWHVDQSGAATALRTSIELIERHRWTNFLALLPREAGLAAHRALKTGGAVDAIRESIRVRRLPAPEDAGPGWPWPLRVVVLGKPKLERFDETMHFQGKVQRKPLELLKYLACARDTGADHTTVCAALWPDAEEFAARRSLEVATARLREMLGNATWVRVVEGRTRLDRDFVWCDAQALWRLCAQAEQIAHNDPSPRAAHEMASALLDLYRGPLLEGDEESPWMLGARERLRAGFLRAVRALTDRPGHEQDRALAIALLEQALAAEPLAEELAQRLMRAYADRGQPAEAMRVYRQLRQTLSLLLGSQPSPASERLRQTIAGN